MARASISTLLSLDRFARLLGIAPPNFNSATCNPFFMGDSGCQDVFWQYGWQDHDRTSREEIAEAIRSAEEDMTECLGFPMAPIWIAEEVKSYPRHYRPEVYRGIYNIRDQHVGLKVKQGLVNGGGVRGLTLINNNVVPVYTDADADGFFETATITAATTVTEVNELKVYFHGHAGDMEWEIRMPRTKTLSGGVFTATFYTWQLVNPTLWESFPQSGVDIVPIDLAGNPPTNVVTRVNVYREFNDYTQTTAEFWWESQPITNVISGITGCVECGHVIQAGCLLVQDPDVGIVAPTPATYDAVEDEWTADCLTIDREPDLVKVWYQAGDIDQKYLQGRTYDPLSDYWARMIAMVATARLDKELCGCGCGDTASKFTLWRTDMTSSEGGKGRSVDWNLLDNPLGIHFGEVEVWKKIKRNHIRLGGAAVG